ncbi:MULTISPECIES: hypothetical protein [Paenibacillus]|uniref:hypothetical protein n=1 Tax=Paenibacillus TaxID=44249 RepID=UPI0022B91A5A|nr:hypothetical protein [Paenibacillus caseinilyticus]MCZ8518132.1 hypothetical protein [Paenibacillus caseinilyticus]
MSGSNREYPTGESVPETGPYMCTEGALENFKKDEKFPACPKSGEKTLWQEYNKE